MGTPTYASLLRRYQALIIDGIVIFLIMVLSWLLVPAVLSPRPAVMRVLLVGVIGFALLYEPLMVWRCRGTIGHYRLGLRVVRQDTLEGLPLSAAVARFLFKGVLGLLSLIFMAATRRRQALHDLVAKSVVILADPATATALDVAPEIEPAPDGTLPSAARRVTVIVAYSMLTFILLSVAVLPFTSSACIESNRCSPMDDLLSNASAVASVLLVGVYLALGWRGRLPGCRARTNVPTPAGREASIRHS